MLVYTSTKRDFLDDVRENRIDEKILSSFQRYLGRATGKSEIESWRNSMMYMGNIVSDDGIPDDSGVAIEYVLPQTTKRIDFVLTGKGESNQDIAIIVELKQWEQVKQTAMDGIVRTFVGGAERDVSHPSYQAWSYAAFLEDFNETVHSENIGLRPCAYLHNCVSDNVINNDFYAEHIGKAPAFLRRDSNKLIEFIRKHIKYGDSGNLMYRIDQGRIRPSKSLADKLASLLNGNQEFLMIDDQKVVYENAIALAKKATVKDKHVLIVQGGPGTGKSVVAINLLVALTKEQLVAQYVTKNAAPRTVYAAQLTGSFRKSHIDNLFKGSGAYTSAKANELDVLIVDEAHRLNEKSGMFQNLGENQIKEIIHASKFSVFFIDEDQRVTFKDVGEVESISAWARRLGASVQSLELQSQFRCNGSDGYLAWLDNVLGIRPTANLTLQDVNYDFRVFDSPNALRDAIYEKNKINNKARLVAGYCWDWVSKNNNESMDIVIPEYDFRMRWNLAADGNLWILKPEAVTEVGCIHTCQGLETDYVGVIIGPDFVVRNGEIITDATKRAKTDASIKGYKSLLREDPEIAKVRADAIIKNTYRTLMTRGMKGCYVFCTDKETNEWLKQLIGAQQPDLKDISSDKGAVEAGSDKSKRFPGLNLRLLKTEEVKPYVNAVPLYDLKVAAGLFSTTQMVDSVGDADEITDLDRYDWVELPDSFRVKRGQFVAQVVGDSMNRRIPNGAWCLFSLNPGGSRQGKVVLVQHRSISDPDTGGQYTVKVYQSEKVISDDGAWLHSQIILKPDSMDPSYRPLIFDGDDELVVVAELVAVLG